MIITKMLSSSLLKIKSELQEQKDELQRQLDILSLMHDLDTDIVWITTLSGDKAIARVRKVYTRYNLTAIKTDILATEKTGTFFGSVVDLLQIKEIKPYVEEDVPLIVNWELTHLYSKKILFNV